MKNYKYTILISAILLTAGCSEYLNVVPDGAPTLDNAFSNRMNSERFFYGCYNYLPNFAHPFSYPGYVAGADEMWWDIDNTGLGNRSGGRIAQGQQNITNPYQNYWDGGNDGKRMWIGIRDCNIFLENIDQVPDLKEWERIRWKAEVKFLKAYFHFFLLQLYGPIPIMDKNIEVNASPEDVRIFRQPVDDVIEYIVALLDEANRDLPLKIEELTTEVGRATQAIALSLKAKVLVWAASPLFNGSYAFYQNFKDKRGVQLIAVHTTQDDIRARWQRAAVAVGNAIDTCRLAGHGFFKFNPGFDIMSDTTALKYTLRGCVTERFTYNREVIWACTNSNNEFQNWCTPKVYSNEGGGIQELAATMKMAETYYTRNGLPIDEDPYWDYDTRYETRQDTGTWHKYYIGAGETTAKLNYYREPRFYAHLGFDRGIYELLANTEENSLVIKNRSGEVHGLVLQDHHISTGYYIKKAVSFRIPTNAASPSPYRFSMPIIRLPDLYLLYAEALNESKDTPDEEVYRWVDSVRIRAGLNTVLESWKWAKNPDKPRTKEGMRDIIKRERMIELSFEGQRPFDLRRWLDAEKYMNEPVRGWDYRGTKLGEYYQTTVYFSNRRFTYKDYLWPLSNNTITVNSNLAQNPGW